jgi:hypothetical protein
VFIYTVIRSKPKWGNKMPVRVSRVVSSRQPVANQQKTETEMQFELLEQAAKAILKERLLLTLNNLSQKTGMKRGVIAHVLKQDPVRSRRLDVAVKPYRSTR